MENRMENQAETINGMLSEVIGYISQAEAVVREIEKQQLAATKAAAAPDKTKLLTYAQALDDVSPPSVTSPEGEIIADTINNMLDEVIGCIRQQAKKL